MYKRLLTLLSAVLLLPSLAVQAEPAPTLSEEVNQPFVTLLSDFTLYPSADTKPTEAIGAISSMQSVRLALNEEQRTWLGISSRQKIAVETWLGPAWINLKEGSYKFGKLTVLEQPLTLLQEQTELYQSPGALPTSYTLAPQQVQAIASIPVCDPYNACFGNEKWYLINTSWLGEQWICPYHFVEKYIGTPVEGMIVLDGSMEVYAYPYDKPLRDEPRPEPQVVKPKVKYTQQARMAPPSIWYQVETPKGLRWVHQHQAYGLGIEQVEPVKQSIVMTTPFHFYQVPFTDYRADEEQPPQTLQVLGKQGSWYFVSIDGAGKWVNPSMEAALRMTGEWEDDAKLGVKQELIEVALTESSIVLSRPYFDGTYEMMLGPQSVTASRIWVSPNGETWYYIHTWQGPKWVRP
ncbi:hypothetical protein [Paenibacillus puerhi]|uniref:hypothetical protein n=1 Tax=Paenibacillus puerhi TaxID=2692622 RepID=UPI00135C6C04|nr:hypothetical protein [Paenibacillus puerhi]